MRVASEFIAEIMAAGTIGYGAFLAGRRVRFFGRIGGCHAEEFPRPTS